ncbi:MAG: hypothetical protein ACE14T_06655, partial [Syntrophales bacterium]
MLRKELGKKAFDYFNSGFCYSEAISKTIIDQFADNPAGYPIKVASRLCEFFVTPLITTLWSF